MSLIRYETSPITTLFDDLGDLFGKTFDLSGRDIAGTL